MPIGPVDDPADARALAIDVLQQRTPPGGGGQWLRGAPRQVGALGIYNLALERLADRELGDAVQTGWRYVQLQPNASTGQVVEIRVGNEPEFASFADGRIAKRIDQAANAAASELGDAPDSYEPRILRLPEIHMEALWMHAPDPDVADKFLGLPTSQQDLHDEAFLDEAVERAREYLEKVRPAIGPEAAGI